MATRTETLRLVIDGEEVKNTYPDLIKAQKQLKKELLGLEEGTDDYIKKSQQLNQVSKRLNEVKGSVDEVSKEWKKAGKNVDDNIKNNINGIRLYGTSVGDLKGNFSSLTSSTGGWVRMLGTLKGALIATGIGAFLVIIGALITYFKRSQDGINTWNKITAQAGAVVDVLLDRLVILGKAILQFSSGEYAKAWETAKSAFQGIGDEILREVKLSGQLSDAFAALAVKDAQFISIRAERMKQVKELNFIAEDTARSINERTAAAAKAIAIEQNNMREALALQQERVNLMQQEYDRAESTTEDLVALEGEKAKLFELQTASLEAQTTINNKLNILLDQQRKEALNVVQALTPKPADQEAFDTQADILIEKYKNLQIAITRTMEQEQAHQHDLRLGALQDDAEMYEGMSEHVNAWAGVTTDLNNLIGGQSAALLNFQKGATAVQIALDTAAAISKGIVSAQSVPFPGNLLAIATTLSTVLGNMAQAKALLSTSTPTAPSFYHGGSTGSQSIGMGDANGPYTGFTHANEFVLSAAHRRDPVVANTESYIESTRRYGTAGAAAAGSQAPVNVNASASLDAAEFAQAVGMFMQTVNVLQQKGVKAEFGRRSYNDAKEDFDRKEQNRNRGKIN